MAKKNENILYEYERLAIWWEDATSHNSWKQIADAEKDVPAICFSEGYLVKKGKAFIILTNSFSDDELGDQMIITKKSIKKIEKLGRRKFLKEEFDYKTY
jgi:hypothetical protein